MTVPNLLTVTRIAMAPVFAATYVAAGGPEGDAGLLRLSVAIFIMAFVFDVLDGLFARALHQETGLGAFLDPLSDKVLVATALVLVVIYDSVPIWIVGIVIGRDVAVGGGWLVLRRYGLAPDIKASRIGKTALVFQVIAIVATILNLPGSARWVFWGIALVLTLIAGGNYAFRGLRRVTRRSDAPASSQDSQVA